ncbi:MAG: aminotransferase class I/II-fold pyridoxal phosphate-dependent enzyme [Nitrososphaerota archaeon]|nr:aminotransferase class I/II-fold pyridoxal phosphate-dependent enzyme [Nitrososphaerota archaeon]
MENQAKLEELRTQIAQITREVIQLAGKRKAVAREVGKVKDLKSLPTEDDAVEDALVREVIAECDRVGLERRSGLKLLSVLLAESKRAQGMVERPTPVSVFVRALALQRKGVKILRLDVGEPDFRPPVAVIKACSRALFDFKTHYTEPRGIPELRSALRSYLRGKHGFEADDEEVTVTPSGRFAVYAALSSVLGEGESAVVIEPNWPAYREALRHLGVRTVSVRTTLEDGWTPSVDQVQKALRPNTRALVLSYPNNPTGKVITERLFREMVGLANDLELTVISDEIYNEYCHGRCPSVLRERPKRFILTSSFSKTWAMTGFRIGYAVSSRETISAMSKMTSLMVTSVPEFIQWGAVRALGVSAEVRRHVATMRARIRAACRALDAVPSLEYSKPDGGMYLFPRIRSGESGEEFAEELMAKGVSVTPGGAFGDYPDFFRISLCRPEKDVVDGIRRMGELLD